MKIGRNQPCPCGSGKKYKMCCLKRGVAAAQITREDRAAALAKLHQFAETRFGREENDALDELWEPWDDEEEDPLELMDEPLRRALDDLDRSLQEAIRSGGRGTPPGGEDAGIPPEVAEDLVLELQARHYRGWIDEAIPALGGRTPRQAAADPRRREALVDLIRGLEGMYHRALRHGKPAYDPSWMWAELGLVQEDEAEHPPPLAHERWGQAEPRMSELAGELARRTREQQGFDYRESVISAGLLEADLEA